MIRYKRIQADDLHISSTKRGRYVLVSRFYLNLSTANIENNF